MFKKVLPMFDRVLILRSERQTKSKGGIVLPENAQGRVSHGTVIAVGPGARDHKGEVVPPLIKVGDKVLLPEYGGTKIELEPNKEFQLFRERDILAKFK
ncbi:10 kDa heat shock protein, mitochondrial-like [Cimex lectularius]|uniref:10 kDa heat shock protein, mitochondrial n=1 Tax=Cimex lectularius TaxID=79782 RepID=A0A8I6SPK2_CIMLE|nr:10 kDa heat shock protein, mitochondrial-like [Cimex lectularius]